MDFSKKFYSATTDFTTFYNEVPAPYIRKNLTLDKVPEKAEILIAGLGFYKIFVNGKDITKGLLAPYIANPDDYIYYDKYDLSELLVEGKNVIAFNLGNGILNCPGGLIWDFDKAEYRNAPMLAFTLDIDGKIYEADETLKCAPSPTMFDDLRCGEFYDAGNEIDGWNLPAFDDSEWNNAIKVNNIPRGKCVICEAEPIKIQKELAPVSITPNINISDTPHYDDRVPNIPYKEDEIFPDGGYLYDFGINAAGIFRLKLKNTKKGQKVVLQFGETFKNGGLFYAYHNFLPLRFTYRCIYTCKGAETEIWEPSFHYQGYRYCILFGIEESQATNDALTYLVANSDLKINATFNCSDDISNKIWQAGMTANLANFFYFPTDCPHREKNGWTGDAALSAEQMLVTLTPSNSFREWLKNIRASQDDIGGLPGIVPTYKWGYGIGPCWDIVLINLPYYTWLYTGNTDILKENAHAIMSYLELLYSESHRCCDERGLRYGGLTDWCPATRPFNMSTGSEQFIFCCVTMDIASKSAKMFEALGAKYKAHKLFADELYSYTREIARKYFIDSEKCLAAGRSMVSQASAIFYDVFDRSEKDKAFSELVKIIEKQHGGFDVGIFGARTLFHVLSDFGRTDLAYDMITGTDHPSYGSWIEAGDTAFTENFYKDSIPAGEPSSHNHHMFGDVLSWYIKRICGIWVNPHGDNVNEISIKPEVIPQLTFAEGSENIPAGKVYTKWEKLENGRVRFTLDYPDNVCGFMIAPEGWQFNDGYTFKHIQQGEFILYKETEPNELSDYFKK